MTLQNPKPRTVDQLMDILDKNKFMTAIEDEMTHAACSRLRKVPNQAMVGFNANLEARKWHEEETLRERLADGSHVD